MNFNYFHFWKLLYAFLSFIKLETRNQLNVWFALQHKLLISFIFYLKHFFMLLIDPLLCLFALWLGVCLDLILGDPRWLPHPVRLMGLTISKGEAWTRKTLSNEFLGGFFLTISCISISTVLFYSSYFFLGKISVELQTILGSFFIFWSISLKNLSEEAKKTEEFLVEKQWNQARNQVARIVGRDTLELNSTQIAKATCESVAENFVDGVLAPIFFAFLGGPPLALVYRYVNTFDSMIGYHNRTYKQFGKFAAKLDDLFNYLPARCSYIIICLSSFITGMEWKSAIYLGWRDRGNHLSPNAGWPEAAFAGSLGVQFGGISKYQGKEVHKPKIGDPMLLINSVTIHKSVILLNTGSFMIYFFVSCIFLLVEIF